ncbi:hypothetical protein DSO57_1031384 [Entomophthora muscae]|uniref:Uncharacterized protein n=1 Tax=Entomophthora muscae TaxID=34485 RepID=A0ACC2TBU7_9FUNG|nr:hypothetical protein DSO57_1031384 [Entomophthora muscae]
MRLQQAKREMTSLQRAGSNYLSQLVERQTVETSDSSSISSEAELPSKPMKKSARVPKQSPSYSEGSKSSRAVTPTQALLKKKEASTVTKPRRVHPIPKDENGDFILPVQVGIFTILNLGIVDYRRPSFHTHRYVYPIGFKIQRYYKSTVHENAQACYTVQILDGAQGPRFEITADDRPGEPFTSETSSGVWSQIIKLSNQIRQLKITNSGSGPEFTGFSHPTIAWMIQCLPNVKKCSDYRWQEFEVMSLYQVSTRKWEAPPLPVSSNSSKKTFQLDEDNSASFSHSAQHEEEESSEIENDDDKLSYIQESYSAPKYDPHSPVNDY